MAKIWEYSLRQIFENTAARISVLLYLFLVILAVSFRTSNDIALKNSSFSSNMNFIIGKVNNPKWMISW
jgi:hypothetical protein